MTFLITLMAILFFIGELVLTSYARRLRRRRIFGIYNSSRWDEDEDINIRYQRNAPFSDWLRKTLRRRKALKKASKFLVRKKHTYMLKNKYVMVNFDSRKRVIICIDANNMKNSVTASPQNDDLKGVRYVDSDESYEEYDLFFDVLCHSFNSTSNYAGVSDQIKKSFKFKEKRAETSKKQEQQPKHTDKKIEQININEATEEQLTNLPGVSIVQAKKTINRRNLKGDFKSVEEFFIEIKIKPNFQKKLRKMIFTSAHKVVEKNNDDNDRIIDL